MHEDELAIDTDLARRLVARSFPEYAALSLSRLPSSGSSNAMFRLGEELSVRLPRQPDHNARLRSMGWALAISMMTFPYYWRTMPSRCAARRSMAAAVLLEASGS